MTIEEIKREALRLHPEERAHLARELLNSLDTLTDAELERLWVEEAARRDSELDSGRAVSSPADDVLDSARARRG